jgi:nucleoid-associated protein YgaU
MSSARPAVREVRAEIRRRPGRAARRARRRGLLRLAVLVILVLIVVWLGVQVTTASGSIEPVVYEVRAGDTVWGIAERAYGDTVDLRAAVYEIERVNNVRAVTLQPGDELVLPPESSL